MVDEQQELTWELAVQLLDANFDFRSSTRQVGERRSYRASPNGPALAVWLAAEKVFVELPIEVSSIPRDPELGQKSPQVFRYRVGNVGALLQCVRALTKFVVSTVDTPSTEEFEEFENPMSTPTARNCILYGPPGTGKTYATMRRAVEMCLPDWPLDAEASEVKNKYEELRNDSRIAFVTFHQSYGYEDFVEGLRPQLQSTGQVSYSVVPGVFRRACDSARLPKLVAPGLSGRPLKDRNIYKMSLGASWNDEGVKVFKYCLENRCVLMGWGADVDFTDCKNAEDISERLKQEAPAIDKFKNQVAFVDRLKHELKVGDIVIVSHGNKAFRGIAEVTGEYEFDEEGPFHQSRPVKWLAVFESGRPASEVNAKDFTMVSVRPPTHSMT
jgi:5-methylcytosine-specific restriction protein B